MKLLRRGRGARGAAAGCGVCRGEGVPAGGSLDPPIAGLSVVLLYSLAVGVKHPQRGLGGNVPLPGGLPGVFEGCRRTLRDGFPGSELMTEEAPPATTEQIHGLVGFPAEGTCADFVVF